MLSPLRIASHRQLYLQDQLQPHSLDVLMPLGMLYPLSSYLKVKGIILI